MPDEGYPAGEGEVRGLKMGLGAETDPKRMPGREPNGIGTIVIKLGGSTLGSHDTTLEDVVALQTAGARPVLVHGGGKAITEWMQKQGVRPKFVRGLRVTDRTNIDIVVAVLSGVVNKDLVSSINRLGGRAVGLSGVDGDILRAEPLDPDLGLVGRVVAVDPSPLRTLMEAGFVPIVSPVAAASAETASETGPLLNVNADTAAGEIAAALGSDRLVIMTDIEGVMDSSNRLISRLTERQAEGLVRSNVVAGGMVPKIGACLTALQEVKSAHIVDGRRPHALEDTLAGKQLGTRVG